MAEQTSVNESFENDLPDLIRQLIHDAISDNATDIHVDPIEDGFRTCYRVDGVIHCKNTLNLDDGRHLINQIKVAGQFNIDRVLKPLENRIKWDAPDGGEERFIRVTLVPAAGYEAAHLRILSPPKETLEVDQLGMSDDQLERVRRCVNQPEGLILITGPTGAGKTMTMYSLVSLLNLESSIAVSIEDPVEFALPYVRQVQVDEQNGLSMHEGLHALLRMDPDVILVGETRDSRSAVTVAQAAASGRFVLTTVHSRDAASAIEVMHYLSVPHVMLGNTLRLVIGQDLVRKLCDNCATSRDLRDHEAKLFEDAEVEPPEQVKEANGCEQCRQYGYSGRTGIFQVIEIDDEMGAAIAAGRRPQQIRKMMLDRGHRSLLTAGYQKVACGITSVEEVASLYTIDAGAPERRTD